MTLWAEELGEPPVAVREYLLELQSRGIILVSDDYSLLGKANAALEVTIDYLVHAKQAERQLELVREWLTTWVGPDKFTQIMEAAE